MTENCLPYCHIRNPGDLVRAVRVLRHWYSSEQDIAQLPCDLQNPTENTNINTIPFTSLKLDNPIIEMQS